MRQRVYAVFVTSLAILDAQHRIVLALHRLARRFSRTPPIAAHLTTGLDGELEAFFHIRRLGYTVHTASNGVEAMTLKQQRDIGHIDLLLTDVVMPGMTGEAFVAQVELIRPGIRVLYMSGYELPGAMTGSKVLDKPFSRATLLAKVNQLLTAETGEKPGQAPEQL